MWSIANRYKHDMNHVSDKDFNRHIVTLTRSTCLNLHVTHVCMYSTHIIYKYNIYCVYMPNIFCLRSHISCSPCLALPHCIADCRRVNSQTITSGVSSNMPMIHKMQPFTQTMADLSTVRLPGYP